MLADYLFTVLTMAFILLAMVATISFDNSVHSFHVVCKNNVGFDKFTTSCHRVTDMFFCFASMLKTFTDTICHGFR